MNSPIVEDHLKVRKFNRTTQVVSGWVLIKADIDNSYMAYAELFKWEGNEFRKLPYHLTIAICDGWANDEFMVPDVLKSCPECPPQGTCPMPAVIFTNFLIF